MVDNIWAAAKATKPTVPDLGNFIWQTHHEDIQVKSMIIRNHSWGSAMVTFGHGWTKIFSDQVIAYYIESEPYSIFNPTLSKLFSHWQSSTVCDASCSCLLTIVSFVWHPDSKGGFSKCDVMRSVKWPQQLRPAFSSPDNDKPFHQMHDYTMCVWYFSLHNQQSVSDHCSGCRWLVGRWCLTQPVMNPLNKTTCTWWWDRLSRLGPSFSYS